MGWGLRYCYYSFSSCTGALIRWFLYFFFSSVLSIAIWSPHFFSISFDVFNVVVSFCQQCPDLEAKEGELGY